MAEDLGDLEIWRRMLVGLVTVKTMARGIQSRRAQMRESGVVGEISMVWFYTFRERKRDSDRNFSERVMEWDLVEEKTKKKKEKVMGF